MLFEEIEHDIMEKERFVIEQTETLKEMNDSYTTMIDYSRVLKAVLELIPRIQAGDNNIKASMHGGLLNDSGDSERNYRVSLNAEEEKLAPLL